MTIFSLDVAVTGDTMAVVNSAIVSKLRTNSVAVLFSNICHHYFVKATAYISLASKIAEIPLLPALKPINHHRNNYDSNYPSNEKELAGNA